MSTHAERYTVTVVYNGSSFMEPPFPPNRAVQAAFEEAVRHFGVVADQANLALVYGGNVVLDLHASFPAQGVPSGSTVLLQPRQVRNG